MQNKSQTTSLMTLPTISLTAMTFRNLARPVPELTSLNVTGLRATSSTKLSRCTAFSSLNPFVGKVISLASLEALAREFTNGRKLTGPQIAGILGALPENLRDELIAPYASAGEGMIRLSARVKERRPQLRP